MCASSAMWSGREQFLNTGPADSVLDDTCKKIYTGITLDSEKSGC